MDLIDKYLGEARIKDADIKVGSKFKLPNGETIEIKRKFKENFGEDWVEFNRSGGSAQQGKNETSVKGLRIFLSNWKAVSETSLLATIGSMGRMPGQWGERLGSFGTVLASALKKAGVEVHGIKPIGKFENEITVSYNGKKKKVKLDMNSSAAKVVKKITGKYEG